MAGPAPATWGLECCFACHKPMRTPLHLLKVRHMGMYKVHRDCYRLELFKALDVEQLVLIGVRNFEELDKPKHIPNKDPKQPELFNDD